MRLPKVLDLAAAEELRATLVGVCAEGAAIILNASDVEVIGLPCLQVLVAAAKTAASLAIERPSAAFINALQDYGFDERVLGAPPADTGEAASTDDGASAPADQPAVESMTESAPADETQAPPEHASKATEGGAVEKRILTIDDSKTMRDMLMLALTNAGYQVVQAIDGQDGLEVLRKEAIDVVITDINMPRLDGYGVIRRLREDPNHQQTPILVLSTESEQKSKDIAREAGATGWLVKPFDPERLVDVIRKVSP